jgi:hypothetical protein
MRSMERHPPFYLNDSNLQPHLGKHAGKVDHQAMELSNPVNVVEVASHRGSGMLRVMRPPLISTTPVGPPQGGNPSS